MAVFLRIDELLSVIRLKAIITLYNDPNAMGTGFAVVSFPPEIATDYNVDPI